MIQVLSKATIDKIAAGEVIERPMSIVKELVENSIDAGSTAVTVEIKDGGIGLVRVTDNGSGINCAEVRTAFLRHATGKITKAEDLESIHSLGFRGEALSSIAAVTRTEIITKTADAVTAVRYCIEGGEERSYEEIGAPDGTTIIVRDLFYNTLPRKKFLKTASTEGSHIAELMEKFALSHPDISFRFINSGQTKLQTSGNGNLKDIIYQIYGRDITSAVVPVTGDGNILKIRGYIAKPEVSRPNRNYETYFINGRYIKSNIIYRAIEDGFEGRLMQHQFPFAVLILETDPGDMDVNVHPTKMDVRFTRPAAIYDEIVSAVKNALDSQVLIPHAQIDESRAGSEARTSSSVQAEHTVSQTHPSRPAEPFERSRIAAEASRPVSNVIGQPPVMVSYVDDHKDVNEDIQGSLFMKSEQMSFAQEVAKPQYRIIGQVFSTYWIIELGDKMYIIDQHAAHEKIFYERLLRQFRNNRITSQQLDPPVIVTLSDTEAQVIKDNYDHFARAGFEIETFGGKEYAVRAVPDCLPSINKAELLKEMISDYTQDIGGRNSEYILEKTASMACKAAIKGGQKISYQEADILIKELLECDNPYCCPHGRPTMIEFTKTDLEKKFRRIV